MPGTLFVVATPIGNLEDLTFRALRTLREVDLIAAEDTRRTAKLLARYEIRKPMVSLREHNEVRETPRLLDRMGRGESIALVSDAGTPGISDPGARFVASARAAGIPVVALPGPSAVTAALSIAGVGGDQFTFLGFPPSSGKARSAWIEDLTSQHRPVVFFEAPHRIRRTVTEILSHGIRPIFAHREISKIHDELVVCTTTETAATLAEAGEYTVVANPMTDIRSNPIESAVLDDFERLTRGLDSRDDILFQFLAWRHSATPAQVKKLVKKASISAKQQNASST